MSILEIILIVIGLTVFEIVSSVDNAVVNADVLNTVSEKMRKWFLFYGIFFAVFIVRGMLPLLIIYFSNPDIGIIGAFTSAFSSSPEVHEIIEKQTPILLAGGGVFLVFLFLHWFFMEKKNYAFFLEKFIHHKYSFWFYALSSVLLLVIVSITYKQNSDVSFAAVIGSTAFFIVNGFKSNAEHKEDELTHSKKISDFSKILYLELIDLTFSIDGVLGAFAFTTAVPLILVGNGIGAVIVRQLTVKGVHVVKKYAYLKNGAMYSIGILGSIMVFEGLGVYIESWVSPVITFILAGGFFYISKKELVQQN